MLSAQIIHISETLTSVAKLLLILNQTNHLSVMNDGIPKGIQFSVHVVWQPTTPREKHCKLFPFSTFT